MTRHERLRQRFARLEALGIVQYAYTYRPGTGVRWVFTPAGFGERSLSTSEAEDFCFGAEAALAAREREER